MVDRRCRWTTKALPRFTNWTRIKLQLSESYKKKNDSEISAILKKITEGLSEKIEHSDKENIENIMTILNNISKESRNQDINKKSVTLLARCRDKFPEIKIAESSKVDIKDRLGIFLPGLNNSKK